MDQASIEQLKTETDLTEYIRSRGVDLKEVGLNLKGFCPFHEEKSPSFTVNPRENLWQCFGCGSGGDVFTFVERLDKVGFKEAVSIVKGSDLLPRRPIQYGPNSEHDHKPGPGNHYHALDYKPDTVKKIKLLNLVMGFYQKELFKDKRGLNYLRDRGITDKQSLVDFGAGFVAGNLTGVMPSDEDTLKMLQEVGILNKNGHEMFYGCVVFPLRDFEGNVLSIYGRRIDKDQVAHLYLPGPRMGLVNWQTAKRSKTIILTESIIDALTLNANGFKNAIPIYGVNGFNADHAHLIKKHPPETIYLCFDNDEAGLNCAIRIRNEIRGIVESTHGMRRISVHTIKLPIKDVNDYFRKYQPEEFEQLLKEANPNAAEQNEHRFTKSEKFFEPTRYGFFVAFGNREYEIKSIARQGTQLKATIKASLDIKNSDRFQITTLDFYSLRSREWFAKVVSDLTGERIELVLDDLNGILTHIEKYNPNRKEERKGVSLTDEEKKEALKFLNNPKLFDEVLADLEKLGFTGEETNKLVAYLVAVSRKMEEPLSLLIQSRSAAGKSTLQDAIVDLVPEEDKVKYTRLTDQALFYKDENSLQNKVLAIEEAAGVGGSAYSIRALQSAKELTVAATSKDPATGKLKTEEYKVKGPLSIMLTTTAVNLDAEMESRFLAVSIDESIAMTQRIHSKQRESETLDGYLHKKQSEAATKKHHNAQRLLKPLAVINPYAPYLNFPSDNLRSRRDHKKYLGLIKAIAFLHQYQRKTKTMRLKENDQQVEYIEATLDDIALANRIANEVLGQSLSEISAPSRTLLNIIQKMAKQMTQDKEEEQRTPRPVHHFIFNRRQIREFAKWSDWQVRTHIAELEELGYVYSRLGSKGKEYIYELLFEGTAEGSDKMFLGLTDISKLKNKIKGTTLEQPAVLKVMSA